MIQRLFFGRANSYLNRLRCGMGLMLQNKTGVSMDDVRVVRFEDVKQKTPGTDGGVLPLAWD